MYLVGAILTVNAPRLRIASQLYREGRRETPTQGGLEETMPPQAAVMTFARPASSYLPTTSAGAGCSMVLAPRDFFMILLSVPCVLGLPIAAILPAQANLPHLRWTRVDISVCMCPQELLSALSLSLIHIS